MAIHFFEEGISYKLKSRAAIKAWIRSTIEKEKYTLGELNFIFCSDDHLLSINQQYLNHDTYTDIITFDHSEKEYQVSGDIFISIDRVKENAKKFEVNEFDELCRVLIHGTLHLLGYKDKSKKDKELMRAKEDKYLGVR